MAVPSSGVLSLLAIYNEVAENNYSSGTSRTNVSLNSLSTGGVATINTANASADRPDGGSNNHAMSEFYSYNHDESAASTAWSSVPSNFSISGQNWPDTETANKTISLANGSGNTTVTVVNGSSNTGGTLKVAISTSSTPSSDHDFSDSVSHTSGTLYMQFLWTASRFFDSTSQTNTVQVTNNGVTATFTIAHSQAGE